MGVTAAKYLITYEPWNDCTVFEHEAVSGYMNPKWASDQGAAERHGIEWHNVICVEWFYYDYDKEKWVAE